MRRKLVFAALLTALVVPAGAMGSIDITCTSQTTAVAGTVTDATGSTRYPAGLKVKAVQAAGPSGAGPVTVDTLGRYRLCLPRHETWNIIVFDDRGFQLFAQTSRPFTTFTNLTDRLDFTAASGFPVRFKQSLYITPVAFNSVGVSTQVTFTVETKMPRPTEDLPDLTRVVRIKLSSDVPALELDMTQGTPIGGGPFAGGWNIWTTQRTFPAGFSDNQFTAETLGYAQGAVATQFNREYYFSDRLSPQFGALGTSVCGASSTAVAFSPATTVNRRPPVTIGVCDTNPFGGSSTPKGSGIDVYTAQGTLCPTSAGCTPVNSITNPSANPPQCVIAANCHTFVPTVGTNVFAWSPDSPLALGTYWFLFSVFDRAGNKGESPQAYRMDVVEGTGAFPVIGDYKPSNLQVVATCTCTNSPPTFVSFKVTDADGVTDIAKGSLEVRIYFLDERVLVYEYDPRAVINEEGYGTFTVGGGSWQFTAAGYDPTGKPPGRYLVTATVTDLEGNSASFAWHWVLVVAAT